MLTTAPAAVATTCIIVVAIAAAVLAIRIAIRDMHDRRAVAAKERLAALEALENDDVRYATRNADRALAAAITAPLTPVLPVPGRHRLDDVVRREPVLVPDGSSADGARHHTRSGQPASLKKGQSHFALVRA